MGYVIRRLFHSLVVLFGLSVIIFIISRVLPGDPARMALGPFATQESVEVLRAAMGLDKPLITQYITYIANLFRGDFGYSLVSQRNVLLDLVHYLPGTLELIFCTIFWVLLFGVPLGVISAANKDESVDNVIKAINFAAVVTPGFIIGIAFQLIFGYWLDIMPITGRLSPVLVAPPRVTGFLLVDSIMIGNWRACFDAVRHLFLPSLALASAGIGQIARITRTSMLEVEGQDNIAVLRSYGVPNSIVNFVYMLKPAFSPTLNVTGMTFASLLGNAFLIEMVFSWSGIAKYGINALMRSDINALMGVVLVIGFGFLITNLVVDLLMGFIDPRIRLKGGES